MTDEAVFSYVNQLTNEGVRLNLSAVTYVHVFLNFNKRSDKDVTANRTSINVDWIDDSHVIAKFDIDNLGLSDFWLIQNAPLACSVLVGSANRLPCPFQ